MVTRLEGDRDWAVPPGEILAEALEERQMSQSELARRMARPIKTVNEIINAKAALTADTALQLELVLGIPARLWVNLEASYRRQLAEQRTLEHLATYDSWLRAFPLKDLARHGLVDPERTVPRQIAQLLSFFQVASPDAWRSRWGAPLAHYRKSATYQGSDYARAAWLRWGEMLATEAAAMPFDADQLRRAAKQIRLLTRAAPLQAAIDQATDELRAAGVILVVMPELQGTCLSGATRWIDRSTAVVQLSLRHKTDDHFWFTCLHEVGHLLDRPGRDFVDVLGASAGDYDDPKAEARADAFARDALIDASALGAFVEAGSFNAASVRAFADAQRVAPGVVVGRLQHDGVIPYGRLNELKKPVRFA